MHNGSLQHGSVNQLKQSEEKNIAATTDTKEQITSTKEVSAAILEMRYERTLFKNLFLTPRQLYVCTRESKKLNLHL